MLCSRAMHFCDGKSICSLFAVGFSYFWINQYIQHAQNRRKVLFVCCCYCCYRCCCDMIHNLINNQINHYSRRYVLSFNIYNWFMCIFQWTWNSSTRTFLSIDFCFGTFLPDHLVVAVAFFPIHGMLVIELDEWSVGEFRFESK